MEPTDKQVLYGKLRRAGKDLKPIIVIFAFAIVMTVVAITVSGNWSMPVTQHLNRNNTKRQKICTVRRRQ